MQITHLYIDNYRIIHGLDLDFTSNQIYMIGRNGSGKSTILEAIAEIFAHIYEVVGGFVVHTPNFKYYIEYIINDCKVFWSSEDVIVLDDKEVTLGRFRSENALHHLLPNNVFLYYAGITNRMKVITDRFLRRYRNQLAQMNGDRSSDNMPAPSPFIYADGRQLDITFASLLANDNQQIRQKLLIPDDAHIVLKIRLKKPRNNEAKEASNEDLWGEKSSMVLKFIAGLIEKSEEYDLSTKDRLSIIIESLSLASYANAFEGRGKSVYQFFEYLSFRRLLDKIDISWALDNGDVVNLQYLSEGEKQVILAIGAIDLWGNNNTLLLLDEPDTFLHPTWQNAFVSEVVRNLGSNQVYVTTHSSLMLSSVKNGQIFSVSNGVIENWSRRTFGMDSSSILSIVMDSEQRDKDAQNMQTNIMECCNQRNWEGAKKLLSEYEEVADTHSGEVMRMRAYINRMEKISR